MKTYELNAVEAYLALTALRFTAEQGYTYEIEHGGDLTDYHGMKALIDRLEPKPVKKEGWVGLYAEDSEGMPSIGGAYMTEKEVRENCPGARKFVRITWEE